MLSFNSLRGKLVSASASLAFSLSNELLKWQYPVTALAEKLAFLAAALRIPYPPFASQTERR